jgi:folate-binding protein YgfZ
MSADTESPLAAWAQDRGARPAATPLAFTPWADLGDADAEKDAARTGCALVDLGGWGALKLEGKDPAAFLHKYLTQDVKGLVPGQAAYGCALSLKGGLVTDLWALRRETDLLALTPPAGRARLAEHLKRYALLDRTPLSDSLLGFVALVGPRQDEVAAAAGLVAPPLGAHVVSPGPGAGEGRVVARVVLCGVPALVAGVSTRQGPEFVQRLADELVAAGAVPAGTAAVDPLRVEALGGLLGVDLDESTLPIEAGLEAAAISYTKGCYLGQEVIARLAGRGHVNRTLRRVQLEAKPPACPAPLFAEGAPDKPATTLTTCVGDDAGGGDGLALVHRKFAPGTALHLGAVDGPRAVVH